MGERADSGPRVTGPPVRFAADFRAAAQGSQPVLLAMVIGGFACVGIGLLSGSSDRRLSASVCVFGMLCVAVSAILWNLSRKAADKAVTAASPKRDKPQTSITVSRRRVSITGTHESVRSKEVRQFVADAFGRLASQETLPAPDGETLSGSNSVRRFSDSEAAEEHDSIERERALKAEELRRRLSQAAVAEKQAGLQGGHTGRLAIPAGRRRR